MLNTSPPPLVRTNRFWDALRNYKIAIIPLHPWSDIAISDCRPGTFEIEICHPHLMTDEQIWDLELEEFNVGLACGAVSGCTVLAAETVEADEWVVGKGLPETGQSWSRVGRYYHFNYCPPEQLQGINLPVAGLRVLNDSDYLTYPGSVYEGGRIANWEIDPAWEFNADFPLKQLLV